MNTLSVEQALKHAKCEEVIHNIMNGMISCIRGIHNSILGDFHLVIYAGGDCALQRVRICIRSRMTFMSIVRLFRPPHR